MKNIVVLFAFLVLTTGCATLFTGTHDDVNFASEPAGTRVEVGGQTCTTPCVLTLPKGGTYFARFSHEGYESKSVLLNKEFNPITLINFFGLLGWAVDIIDGAMWNVSPGAVNTDLSRAPASK